MWALGELFDSSNRRHRILLWIVGIFTVLSQLPFLSKDIGAHDEASIFYMAWQITQGAVLYKDIYTFLSPAVYYLVALIFKIDHSIFATRLLTAFVFLLTSYGIWRLAKHLVSVGIALLAVLTWTYFKFYAYPMWSMINYTPFSTMCTVFAASFFLFPVTKRPILNGLVVGALVGIVFLFKTHNAYAFAIAVVAITGIRMTDPKQQRGTLLWESGAILGTFAGIVAFSFLFFAFQGALNDYFYSAIVVPAGAITQSLFIEPPVPQLDLWNGMTQVKFVYFPDLYFTYAAYVFRPWFFPLAQFYLSLVAYFLYYGITSMLLFSASSLTYSWFREKVANWRSMFLVGLSILFCATIFYRADVSHIASIFPVLLGGVLAFFACLKGKKLGNYIQASWLGMILVGLVIFLFLLPAFKRVNKWPMPPPLEKVKVSKIHAEYYAWLSDISQRKEVLFVPWNPLFYYSTRKTAPGGIVEYLPAYLDERRQEDLIRQLPDIDMVIYEYNVELVLPSFETTAPKLLSEILKQYCITTQVGDRYANHAVVFERRETRACFGKRPSQQILAEIKKSAQNGEKSR